MDGKKEFKGNVESLTLKEFKNFRNDSKVLILDVRNQEEFAKSHIPKSMFIGLNRSFTKWIETLIADVTQQMVLIIPEGKEEETINILSNIGFNNVLGYLEGGFTTWLNSENLCDTISQITVSKLETIIKDSSPIFDVRKNNEFSSQRITTAKLTPLASLDSYWNDFQLKETFYIHCGGGYRSVIAASLLKRKGIHNFVDIIGGFVKIKESNLKLTDHICLSKL